jgi:hypothetical protein
MKKHLGIMFVLCFGLLIAAPLWGPAPRAATPQTYSGEIMDSLCAKNGNHDKMMGEMKSMGHDKKTCSVKCIQLGAKYVLYDARTHAAYALDNQDQAEAFAGQTVRVVGTLEKNKIKVGSIEPAGGAQ